MRRAIGVAVLVCTAIATVVSVSAGDYACGRLYQCPAAIRGAHCSIVTAPEPDLHGGDYSVACVGATNADGTRGVEVGYGMFSGRDDLLVYAIWIDDDGNPASRITTTVPGSGARSYECYEAPGGSVWSFRYGGAEFDSSADETLTWTAVSAYFVGGVPSTGVQLVGDSSNKVRFSGLQVYVPNPWRWVDC